MLHLVTGSPSSSAALSDALAAAGDGDELVLMHSAVLAAAWAAPLAPGVASALARARVHAMAPDLAARGLAGTELRAGIDAIDDAGLLALALRHAQSLTWS
jgi:tRNA 2-thiouridine synthesizing protein B